MSFNTSPPREKLLPQNIEAECGVLGSLIIDPQALHEVADFLLPDDFYRDAHRTIYEVILTLTEERGEPADFITICDELERLQKLDQVGGANYITSLINQVPTSGNVEYYGRIVERTAILRRLIHAAGRIAALAYEQADADAALSAAESLIFQIGARRRGGRAADFESGTVLAPAYLDQLERVKALSGITGLPSGYAALDQRTGGFQKGDLLIAAGRPSMGKTAFALNIAARAIVKYRARVALFSLEMSKEQLLGRLFSMLSGIEVQRLRSNWPPLDDREWERLITAMDTLATDALWINDESVLDIQALRSLARRLHARTPIDLLIVDYLQLLQAVQATGKRYENRVQELSEITRGLKALAKELDVPVLALAQLSRKVEDRVSKVPILSDLRESGSIENDADVVLLLYREKYYHPQTERRHEEDIIIAKQRNGPVDEVTLYFDEPHVRFFHSVEEWAQVSRAEEAPGGSHSSPV